MTLCWFRISCVFAPTLMALALSLSAMAVEPETTSDPDTSAHPLASTIRFAKSHSQYIREAVQDYSCSIAKRERIDGELQPYHYIRAKVRCGQRQQDRLVEPMAVFLQYRAPKHLKDRRVLYIEGKNDGMMLVRKGGNVMKYLQLTVDPDSRSARRDSNYPITDFGLDRVIDRLVGQAEKDIENDPTASNTQVSYFRNAKVKDRVCTHIRVTHPASGDGFGFHTANLYIDDELHVPIRLVVHGWPTRADEPPPLNEEYNYMNLRLNVGLTDADFSESHLETLPSQPSEWAAP
ncbi:DUF1571 domain-containing protein [Novipirellula artificiosorum]|uniref:Outer membrane lipoprotein-sorting protein n=1 Tax=Novipirellula artificiosorum TaxID=2528016 RepID=A0A5C6DDP5_9BACT|nr:DUF1571 domain-containing protein [Novipirellula artificiosorum]TWU34305.1 hypothetical protein Poly41_44520 [Novipirellula artificiosorum]